MFCPTGPRPQGSPSPGRSAFTTAAVDHKIYAGREEFENSVQILLDLHRIELDLSRRLHAAADAVVRPRLGRQILNIHPALLPAYRGLHTHERALADGVKIHGCTVHFVVPEMDEGPIIAQAAVAVLDDDTPDTLAARVLAQEHVLYPAALAEVARGRVHVAGNRTRLDGTAQQDLAPLQVPKIDH